MNFICVIVISIIIGVCLYTAYVCKVYYFDVKKHSEHTDLKKDSSEIENQNTSEINDINVEEKTHQYLLDDNNLLDDIHFVDSQYKDIQDCFKYDSKHKSCRTIGVRDFKFGEIYKSINAITHFSQFANQSSFKKLLEAKYDFSGNVKTVDDLKAQRRAQVDKTLYYDSSLPVLETEKIDFIEDEG